MVFLREGTSKLGLRNYLANFYYKINVLMHDYSIYSCVGVKHTFSCYFAGIICPRGLFNLPLKVGFEHKPILKIIGTLFFVFVFMFKKINFSNNLCKVVSEV